MLTMTSTSAEQQAAATRLGVSLKFPDTPLTVARLVELVDELQRRVEALEQKKGRAWPG